MAMIGIGLVLLLTLAAPAVPVVRVETRVDEVTGSMISTTFWPGGITSRPRLQISPLETRLKSSGIAWTPSPRFLTETGFNVFGGTAARSCSRAPTIYLLRPLLKEFAAVSTDEELCAFVRIMQSGTDEERRAAVEAALERTLDAL